MRTNAVKVLCWAGLLALLGGAPACGGEATPGPTAFPLQAPGWTGGTVSALCLEVDASFSGDEPVAEEVERILGNMGIDVVRRARDCQATLAIDVTGEALSSNYLGQGTCYTGAAVTGEMRLAAPGQAPLAVELDQRRGPPARSAVCPSQPRGAPFDLVWIPAILRGLVQLWGPQVVEVTLWDRDETVANASRDLIPELGAEVVPFVLQSVRVDPGDRGCLTSYPLKRTLAEVGMDAVPALIEGLEEGDACMGTYAHDVLVAITGQDFGKDAAAWRDWWEGQ